MSGQLGALNNFRLLFQIESAWRTLELLFEEGKVRAIGVSNFNTQLLSDMLTYCEVKPAIC